MNCRQRADAIQAELNSLSREIGSMMKDGRKAEAEAAKEGIGTLKEQQKELVGYLRCRSVRRCRMSSSGSLTSPIPWSPRARAPKTMSWCRSGGRHYLSCHTECSAPLGPDKEI
ncbi:MAG: hypothetical protein MZV63_24755 [Marinilabiliales bacterium]|nr:hypothetical protein [Marinilabiliales bacterium]